MSLLFQAEAEEAERQARVSLEMKKSLTHILLHVTDSLFGTLLCLHAYNANGVKSVFRSTDPVHALSSVC